MIPIFFLNKFYKTVFNECVHKQFLLSFKQKKFILLFEFPNYMKIKK